MFTKILLLSGVTATSAFAPLSMAPRAGAMAKRAAVCGLSMQASTAEKSVLTPELFGKLDKDGSGTIDINELKGVLGNTKEVQALMARGDLDGNGEIDYAEYERMMNMDKFSDEQGGNLYVRNAIKFGLLKPDSVLSDCVMVGNKGFDPLNCATNTAVLKQYREAELKHGRLA
eukprot:CAMPEP_0181304842 /NCGR_PEP_ID=MMETSP1101-20121128/9384_1 /TAXON_ID=46948 /ORGANISM="Rhodomonas abbreviata, Strain Caron Lab Isolate" /LENGTH=172 /DNA_ID=CAMNT_0023410663 /DNA_START=14 /DNA_END=529 /DNA_ORIENTATION=+